LVTIENHITQDEGVAIFLRVLLEFVKIGSTFGLAPFLSAIAALQSNGKANRIELRVGM